MAELVREIVIDATPDTIWPFLTDPARHIEWMGTIADLDPRPGGRYRVLVAGQFDAVGEFVEVVEHERVVFTFGWNAEGNLVPPGSSTVEITLQPEGDKTRLRLAHRGLPDGDAAGAHGLGWDHYTGRLAVAAAGGAPGPDRGPGEGAVDPVAAHDRALDVTGEIIARIEPAQFDAPTPCPAFDVRALLDHLVSGNLRFVQIAGGAPGEARPAMGAHVEGDAVGPYRRSAAAVSAAWQDPSLLEQTFRLPIGEVPGTFAIGIHTVEAIVHGWDLARATGQPTEIEPELCAVAWQHCAGIDDSLRGPGGPFGPAVDVPAGASDTDRLVAWLGRTP